MRIGILGTGFMGKMHAEIYRRFSDVTLKGIVGRNESKVIEVANSLETKAYTNPDDLISSDEVDIIDVCHRFQSQYKYIFEYIKSEKLGKPKSIFANRRSQSYWSSNDMIVNLMIHDFDFTYWLLGKPNAVISLGTKTMDGKNESINVLLEYENILASLEGNTIMPKSFPFSTSLRIVCEKGAIELDWHWGSNGPVNDVTLYPDEGNSEKLVIQDYDPYEAECRYFIDCVNGKADPALLGIESAYNSLKIAVTARQSFLERGKKIKYE